MEFSDIVVIEDKEGPEEGSCRLLHFTPITNMEVHNRGQGVSLSATTCNINNIKYWILQLQSKLESTVDGDVMGVDRTCLVLGNNQP